MNRDMKTMCEGCVASQKIGKLRKRIAILFLRIAMDFVGPLPRTNNYKGKNILVLMDYGTRWPEARAVSVPTSIAAADIVLDVCCHFGVPGNSYCQGVSFCQFFTVHKKLGIRRKLLTLSPSN